MTRRTNKMAEMRNVVLARVDDRLIHGEVVTAWTPTFKANKIIIIDDEVAKDTFNVRVVKALAPAGTKVIVYNVKCYNKVVTEVANKI